MKMKMKTRGTKTCIQQESKCQEQRAGEYAMEKGGMCVECRVVLVVCIMEGSRELLAFSAGRKTALTPHADSRRNP